MHLNGDISIQGLLTAICSMLIVSGGALWKIRGYFKGAEDRQKAAETLIESRHAENKRELAAIKTSTADLESRAERKFEAFGESITQLRMEQCETKATVSSLAMLVKECWGVNSQVKALLEDISKTKKVRS